MGATTSDLINSAFDYAIIFKELPQTVKRPERNAKLWVPARSFKDASYALLHYALAKRVQDEIASTLEVVNIVDLIGEDMIRALRR